jgi:pyruvate/2-oxoglutarate dehydrogenase complex dihydrolipoamide dehydrogenase (E3) component
MTRAPGNGRASERRQAYNLVVIGNGAAVQVRALRVRAAEWSVALIDHLPFGGTCALRRCDPKEDADQRCRGDAIDWAKRMRGRGVTIELAITGRVVKLVENADGGHLRWSGYGLKRPDQTIAR